PYGLAGAVHSADIERGVAVARRIDAGMVHVNDSTVADEPTVPYGGERLSGWLSIQRERSEFPF
ncbi:aldehyde dehydrogenase family protein, partial [Streptomyces sp. PU-14G]|uniref:aldehyde dehydrogenase family protein n=1 Tax=Streptomyces sp. PU-14G TaxID=2800808 RepID=UPI0034DEA4A9